MAMKSLTPDRVRELFRCDPETGGFWFKVRGSKRDPNFDLSTRRPVGYIKIMIDGKYYLLHRLIWAHVYGKWPEHFIDHINRNRFDNRIVNLREATFKQNAENSTYRIGMSGLQGVTWDPNKSKWRAHLTHYGKCISLGYHLDKHEAHAAYLKMKRKLHEHATV